MKKVIRTSAMLLLLPLLISGCKNNPKTQVQKTDTKEVSEPSDNDLQKRGEYIVNLGGCNDCHSPKELGPNGPVVIESTRLSGYPANRPVVKADPKITKEGYILFVPDLTSASGPWGVSFAANLTSDQTGIGNWTEENFRRALKEGRYKGLAGSRMLLPPMPWQNFENVKDDDISAIFTYLKSTRPVNNIVPAAILAEVPGTKPTGN